MSLATSFPTLIRITALLSPIIHRYKNNEIHHQKATIEFEIPKETISTLQIYPS